MANKTFEIVRLAIVNDQLGNPKELTRTIKVPFFMLVRLKPLLSLTTLRNII